MKKIPSEVGNLAKHFLKAANLPHTKGNDFYQRLRDNTLGIDYTNHISREDCDVFITSIILTKMHANDESLQSISLKLADVFSKVLLNHPAEEKAVSLLVRKNISAHAVETLGNLNAPHFEALVRKAFERQIQNNAQNMVSTVAIPVAGRLVLRARH